MSDEEQKNLNAEEKENQPADLAKELAEVKQQAEEYLNGWKRAQADYQNQQKDFQKLEVEIVKFANSNIILELIAILDNFKRAENHLPADLENNEWQKGIKQIYNQLNDLLKKFGVEEIETMGKKFDPNFHQAIGHEKKEGIESQMIIQEVETGYTMYDKVIKPSKVVISE